MAKLILKSPYYKGGAGAEKMLEYVATREGVEKLPKTEVYANYIATRPGVEKQQEHGLFSDTDHVDLEQIKKDLQNYKGNVWTHIISLKREDAARLGFDHARPWIHLLRAHRNDIAQAMKIEPQNFRWYAAYHDKEPNPHVHMMAWSVKEGEGYLNENGIAKIKSKLMNDIFKDELLHLYEESSGQRDELIHQARQRLQELTHHLPANQADPQIEQRLRALAQKLQTTKGKKKYGYLPKPLKREVDEIMELLIQRPELAECYHAWQDVRDEIASYYGDPVKAEEEPITKRKEFKPVKNAIIQAAVELGEQQQRTKQTVNATASLILSIANIIADTPPAPKERMAHIDRKRRQELRRKRIALGRNANDTETIGIQM